MFALLVSFLITSAWMADNCHGGPTVTAAEEHVAPDHVTLENTADKHVAPDHVTLENTAEQQGPPRVSADKHMALENTADEHVSERIPADDHVVVESTADEHVPPRISNEEQAVGNQLTNFAAVSYLLVLSLSNSSSQQVAHYALLDIEPSV